MVDLSFARSIIKLSILQRYQIIEQISQEQIAHSCKAKRRSVVAGRVLRRIQCFSIIFAALTREVMAAPVWQMPPEPTPERASACRE
jgi:hypothetical protein